MDIARKEGEKRQNVHTHNSTPRFYKNDPALEDTLGVMAEIAFAKWSNLNPDLSEKIHGDGCKDFEFQIKNRVLTIDIKAARKPFNLLLKEQDAKRSADILVLCGIDENAVKFMGWEHKSIMLIMPKKDFGYGYINYYRHSSQLRPMGQLKNLLEMANNGLK
jgi:hypothetical protein